MTKYIAIGFIVLIIIVFVLSLGWAYSNYDSNKQECAKYEGQYNFITEFEGDMWQGSTCYIITTEGFKININDFDLTTIVTPMRKD